MRVWGQGPLAGPLPQSQDSECCKQAFACNLTAMKKHDNQLLKLKTEIAAEARVRSLQMTQWAAAPVSLLAALRKDELLHHNCSLHGRVMLLLQQARFLIAAWLRQWIGRARSQCNRQAALSPHFTGSILQGQLRKGHARAAACPCGQAGLPSHLPPPAAATSPIEHKLFRLSAACFISSCPRTLTTGPRLPGPRGSPSRRALAESASARDALPNGYARPCSCSSEDGCRRRQTALRHRSSRPHLLPWGRTIGIALHSQYAVQAVAPRSMRRGSGGGRRRTNGGAGVAPAILPALAARQWCDGAGTWGWANVNEQQLYWGIDVFP